MSPLAAHTVPIPNKSAVTTDQTNTRLVPPPPPTAQKPPPPVPRKMSSDISEPLEMSQNTNAVSNIKPDIELPDDWICAFSDKKNKWYYFNKKSKESIWDWPPPAL